jgi:hypothetical protein
MMICILWLYRPDEKRSGRQPSHGADELLLPSLTVTVKNAVFPVECIEEPITIMQ